MKKRPRLLLQAGFLVCGIKLWYTIQVRKSQGGTNVESITGAYNWKLTIRREEAGVTILRAATCDKRAALPEELFGLPVIALADHALCPTARPIEGEEVLVKRGLARPDAAWDNREVEELSLPASVRRVGNYAFLNCRGLRTLRLYDGIRFWGASAFMNCRLLDHLYLERVDREQRETLYYFVGEMSKEVQATIVNAGGETARLVFPEYQEVYEENVPHHQFNFRIQGAGYVYRQVFRNKKLSLGDYDALWKKFLSMEHEPDCALRLAWRRLRWNTELAEEYAGAYRAYLRRHTAEAMAMLLEERDGAGLAFLLTQTEPDKATLAELCAAARERELPELLAILLEDQHKRFPVGRMKSFEL